MQVNLDTDSMDHKRQPDAHTETNSQRSTNLDRVTVVHSCVDDSLLTWVCAIVVRRALRIGRENGITSVVNVIDLVAGASRKVIVRGGDDRCSANLNDAFCNDASSLFVLVSSCTCIEESSTYIKPASKHPSAMLLNLELLDVGVGQDEGDYRRESDSSEPSLRVQSSAECMSHDHETADHAQKEEQQDKITINAVEQDGFMSYRRRELQYDQESCRQNRRQMHDDSDLILRKVDVVIAFARRRTVPGLWVPVAEYTVEV